jgi:CDP-glucose 4,6-dehydratase
MVKTKFWKDRKVLITGQTGFKGAWLTYYLLKQKADITGIALPPVSEQDQR